MEGRPAGAPPSVPQSTRQAVTAPVRPRKPFVAKGREPEENFAWASVRECPRSGDPERRVIAYDVGSTTLATTQRCLPILRSRTNPSFS